ncbi:hypothetical protein Gorai_023923 [Gossypium raimondii]|uniref:Uncharacterized protein n=1 Tax=Gossypium raimondii TaxID=29730 RepID=A0A7J8NYD3_GOSRA|nr:hypothetical protein [Gossypium raimondii]
MVPVSAWKRNSCWRYPVV